MLSCPILGSCGCITVGKAARVPAKSDAEFQFKFRTPSTWGVFKHSIRFVAGNTSYETKIRGKVTTVK